MADIGGCTRNSQCRASWKNHPRILTSLEWARNNLKSSLTITGRSERLLAVLPRVVSGGKPMNASPAAAGAMARVVDIDAQIELHGSVVELFRWRSAFMMDPKSPPKLHITPRMTETLKQWGPNTRVRRGYEQIRTTIARGQKLGTPPLSKNHDQLQRAPDFLLRYWGIHHLYLDKKNQRQVLFAHVDLAAQNVTFLDIRDKPSRMAGWFDRSLVELLVTHCPEGDWMEIKGIDDLETDFTDCEIYHLQNVGLVPIFKLNNKFIMSRPLSLRGRAILDRMARQSE